jgi:hypothetical protein
VTRPLRPSRASRSQPRGYRYSSAATTPASPIFVTTSYSSVRKPSSSTSGSVSRSDEERRSAKPRDLVLREADPQPSGTLSAAALADGLEEFVDGHGPKRPALESLVQLEKPGFVLAFEPRGSRPRRTRPRESTSSGRLGDERSRAAAGSVRRASSRPRDECCSRPERAAGELERASIADWTGGTRVAVDVSGSAVKAPDSGSADAASLVSWRRARGVALGAPGSGFARSTGARAKMGRVAHCPRHSSALGFAASRTPVSRKWRARNDAL